jgi:hypothetical protein
MVVLLQEQVHGCRPSPVLGGTGQQQGHTSCAIRVLTLLTRCCPLLRHCCKCQAPHPVLMPRQLTAEFKLAAWRPQPQAYEGVCAACGQYNVLRVTREGCQGAAMLYVAPYWHHLLQLPGVAAKPAAAAPGLLRWGLSCSSRWWCGCVAGGQGGGWLPWGAGPDVALLVPCGSCQQEAAIAQGLHC